MQIHRSKLALLPGNNSSHVYIQFYYNLTLLVMKEYHTQNLPSQELTKGLTCVSM